MGELHVEALLKSPNNSKYIKQLLTDIEALEHMLQNDMFEKTPIRIGGEQEFCLVDRAWQPSNKALEILEKINDPHFTTEIALYNLEINLDPLALKGFCFSDMHRQLDDLLKMAEEVAEKHSNKIILTGILPTITQKHLDLPYMTPIKRYQILNEAVKEMRKNDFELHIKG
ncbi:MAG: gamma-glutamyl:cysteine ligase YbdK (ATP-grasp superfamily), partial [Sediminicola sp.]